MTNSHPIFPKKQNKDLSNNRSEKENECYPEQVRVMYLIVVKIKNKMMQVEIPIKLIAITIVTTNRMLLECKK